MRKSIIIIVSLLATLSLVGIGIWFFTGNHLDKESDTHANRHISYTIAVKNKRNTVLESVEVYLRGPNKNTLGQRCIDLRANRPFELNVDEANNQSLLFRFAQLPPFATKIVRVDADLVMHPANNKQNHPKNLERFLVAEPHIELSHPVLKELAARLSEQTQEETARNIFNWVLQNIAKTPYSKQPKGALYTLKKKSGDCTEFMHLFVALCRLNNIPTRCISGYVADKDKHLQANDLHDWAQVYINEKWYLADPFYRQFMNGEEHYVAMHVQGDSTGKDAYYRWQTNAVQLSIAMLE